MRVLNGTVVWAHLVWLMSPGWEARGRYRMYQGDWRYTSHFDLRAKQRPSSQ